MALIDTPSKPPPHSSRNFEISHSHPASIPAMQAKFNIQNANAKVPLEQVRSPD